MKSFTKWLEEGKKKTKESLPPTVTSSPLRGQNQDQSGYNGKNDVADYTISDETKPKKINELSTDTLKSYKEKAAVSNDKSPQQSYNRLVGNARATRKIAAFKEPDLDEFVPDNWEDNSASKRRHTVKDLLKLGDRHGAVEFKESSMMAAVGDTRITPVNMGQSTGKSKEPNAPPNVNRLQAAANSRVIKLDKASQKQKDDSEQNKEQEIAKRQSAAKSRQSQTQGNPDASNSW